jgi:hypothetical protein
MTCQRWIFVAAAVKKSFGEQQLTGRELKAVQPCDLL